MNPSITKPWDVQAAAMQAWMDGDSRAEMLVQNAFGTVPVPIEVYFRDIDAMPELEHYALKLCRGLVLDAGAGSGCHSLALEEIGADATALDISPGCCSIMKHRGLQQVVCASLTEYSGGPFDTILLLMNGTGMGGTPEGFTRLLSHLHTLVSPDGQVLCDSTDIDQYMPGWDNMIADTSMELKVSKPGIIEHIVRFRELESGKFPWLYLGSKSFSRIARASGWQYQVVFESDDGHYLARLWH